MRPTLSMDILLLRAFFIGAMAIAVGSSTAFADGEIELSPSSGQQFHGIHICGNGLFLNGIHVGNNEFRCTAKAGTLVGELTIDGDDEPRTVCDAVDDAGKSVKMHCCPTGRAIVGIHVAKNLLVCAEADRQQAAQLDHKLGIGQKLDAHTQYAEKVSMHGCPDNMPMLGFHEGRNLLLCMTNKGVGGQE